jgi:hypothetical protein
MIDEIQKKEVNEMKELTFPGFTAEAALDKTTSRYVARLAGASFSFDGEQVRPAQIYGRLPPVRWTLEIPERLKNIICDLNAPYSQCYQNCIKNYPGYSAGCIWVAADCCKYGYHCSYCEP